jgi:serine phosphatase RsbU (regulator of sigma subunit)/Tfp pilus assembly protein PilF
MTVGTLRSFLLILMVLLGLGRVHSAWGQAFSLEEQREMDGLNAIINDPAAHDTARAAAYASLGEMLVVLDWDTVIVLSRKAQSIAERALSGRPSPTVAAALNRILADALNNIGYILNNQGDVAGALEHHRQCLAISEKMDDQAGMAYTYNNMGAIYLNMGDMARAVEYLQRSTRLREALGDSSALITSYNNLGVLLDEHDDDIKALEYYHKSLSMAEKMGKRKVVAQLYNNIATVEKERGNPALAMEYHLKSLSMREELGDRNGMAESLNNIGRLQEDAGDSEQALVSFRKSLALREQLGDPRGRASSHNSIAGLLFDQGLIGGPDGALHHAQQSLTLSRELGFPDEIKSAAYTLSRIYRKQGNGMEALSMYKLYITMRDSVENEKNRKSTIRMQFQYEFENKEALQAAEQEKKDAIAAEQVKRREQERNALMVGLVLVLGMAGFGFRAYRIKRRDNAIITEQKQEVERQKAEVDLRNDEIMQSFDYARRLQEAVLPPMDRINDLFAESFILYLPRDIVSGDFYWMENSKGIIHLAVGDCTGHGVPGAMLSVIGLNSLNRCMADLGLTRPKDVLMQMTLDLLLTFEGSAATVRDGMDIAFCSIDLEAMTLTYAGANNPLWVARNGEMTVLKADRRPVGHHDSELGFTQQQMHISSGDVIYLCSDGFQDQMGGPDDRKFMTRRLRDMLLHISGLPMEKQQETLLQTFMAWKDTGTQTDDVCVMGVRIP